MRSVVITGTSTGIGWGTAKVLIAHGLRVFGSVRKTSDAERLSAEFGDAFVPLLFDVTDEAAARGRPSLLFIEVRPEFRRCTGPDRTVAWYPPRRGHT